MGGRKDCNKSKHFECLHKVGLHGSLLKKYADVLIRDEIIRSRAVFKV